jgi:hypothetical protein
MSKALCILCHRLSGCELLVDRDGAFLPEAVITEENPDECTRWAAVGPQTELMRKALFTTSGLQAVQAMHMLPANNSRMKEEELTTDFQALLAQGVTYREREEQLQFQTHEDGSFRTDVNGNKVPRTTLELKKYAEELGVDLRSALFWTAKQVRDWVLKTEKDQGYILTPQQKKKLNKDQPEEPMPRVATTNSRVAVRRGAPAKAKDAAKGNGKAEAAPAKGGKVAKPATAKRRGAGKAAAKPKDEAAAPPAEAVAAAVDLTPIMEAIQELRADFAALRESAITREDLDALYEDNIKALTIFHDAFVPNLFPDEEGNPNEDYYLMPAGHTIMDLVDGDGEAPAEGDDGGNG